MTWSATHSRNHRLLPSAPPADPEPAPAPPVAFEPEPDEPLPLRKEDAPCCVARRDADGRLPIGYCGPDCVRRPAA